MSGFSGNFEVRPARPAEQQAALELLEADSPPELRAQQAAAQLPLEHPDGLFVASDGSTLLGALLLRPQPGRTALLQTPQTVEDLTPAVQTEVREALLAAAKQWSLAQGVVIIQALLPTDAGPEAELLKSHGFDHATDLLYLVSEAGTFPEHLPPCPIRWESYSQDNHQRLGQLVQATYIDTLDCPQLNGLREIEDVLSGYRAVGKFDPDNWQLAVCEERDAGCLLLARHSLHFWELVYMGVSPAARGRQLGIELVRYAQWKAGREGARQLALAVDAKNAPAISIYTAAGFTTWDMRSVFLRVAE